MAGGAGIGLPYFGADSYPLFEQISPCEAEFPACAAAAGSVVYRSG
jgi:hypothetical protein